MRDARRTDVPEPEPIPAGLDAVADGLSGRWHSRSVYSERLWDAAGDCEAKFAAEVADCRPNELKRRLNQHHRELRRLGNRWAESMAEVLPWIAGAAWRTLGITPYRTQLMGALALGHGTLAEMATGEGKTLTIALAAVAAGWSGRPTHIVTANDYLAGRDAENQRPLYELCGLSVAAIQAGMSPEERRQVYRADVVYCTGKELVADFLRDRILLGDYAYAPLRAVARLRGGQTRSVLRGIHTAFVDEADNQLIDEAVTPLIISRPEENGSITEATVAAYQLSASFLPGEDYDLNERHKEVELTEPGREKVGAWCAEQSGLLAATAWMCDLVVTALQARHFFQEGSQYVIDEGKLVIVDEFTGRQMPGRSWRLGLHQAVEAKESLEISTPSETLARLSFQRFYRLFRHLGGITGTAREAALEFWRVYRLPFIEVPRHRPNQRRDLSPRFFASESAKLEALVDEVRTLGESGRPVLVGTRSVSSSERIAQMLRHFGVECQVLNAARHEDEAHIIALAGREGRVTIATNMAGRGTDIMIDRGVAEAGGLHVILSEPHESGRVDRQLMGRAGRQGDPGSTRLYASAEDEILQRYLPGWLLPHFGKSVQSPLSRRLLARAQRKAERKGRIRRLIVVNQDVEMSKRLMNRSLDRI
jgi:preprotein translocase subunit SecA